VPGTHHSAITASNPVMYSDIAQTESGTEDVTSAAGQAILPPTAGSRETRRGCPKGATDIPNK